MIGVLTDPKYSAAVKEFFELFKTPWEFYQSGRKYAVLITDRLDFNAADVVVVFASQARHQAATAHADTSCWRAKGGNLAYRDLTLPIHGSRTTFSAQEQVVLRDEESQESALYREQIGEAVVFRVGYDLFHEIHTLLTVGQPLSNAAIPTLELHITLLRDLVTEAGVQLTEIPPVPQGHRFIACLTHDVDHPAVRNHTFDHTMFGFLYRAVVVSPLSVLRGRMSIAQMLRNWVAALKLPFVHLGLAKDFWQAFDSYPALEGCASFFVIPFKGEAGTRDGGRAPSRRASGYSAAEITDQIRTLRSAGCEIGLHGIDAWTDPIKGQAELEEIRRIAGSREVGVRMHWLYFDERSPVALERAGADYDSTIGYNETVGYRAGTTQVYKPLEAEHLLELPLHIMDTALFFPGRLHLANDDANKAVDEIIDNAVRYGGVVTVNWHDRSIAPERLWGDFYMQLLQKLKDRGAWFATAKQTVAWFRKRRSATFEIDEQSEMLLVTDTLARDADLPPLCVRVHNDRSPVDSKGFGSQGSSREVSFGSDMRICVALHTSAGSSIAPNGNMLLEAHAGNL